MGTISTRKTKDGKIRYRAEIRKAMHGYPKFSESKTFGKKAAAEAWLRKREAELDENPALMHGRKARITIGDAIKQYLDEVGANYARTVNKTLVALAKMPVAYLDISAFTRADISAFANARRTGKIEGYEPVSGATVLYDLRMLRSVLDYAELAWGRRVNLYELDRALESLRKRRVVHASRTRDTLPSSDDLRRMTVYAWEHWRSGKTDIPMHVIIWLSIYTARREAELTRLDIRDFNRADMMWRVRDVKTPYGSAGNHKSFSVLPAALPLIDLLLTPEYRDRMGGDPNLLLPLNPRTVGARFRRNRNRLGIDRRFCFHTLRHEGITRLAEDGWSIPQMQTVSMHDSWSSLQRYVNSARRRERLEWGDILLS